MLEILVCILPPLTDEELIPLEENKMKLFPLMQYIWIFHRIAIKIGAETKHLSLTTSHSCCCLCSLSLLLSLLCFAVSPLSSQGDVAIIYVISEWPVQHPANLAGELLAGEAVGENSQHGCAAGTPAQTNVTVLQRSSGSKETERNRSLPQGQQSAPWALPMPWPSPLRPAALDPQDPCSGQWWEHHFLGPGELVRLKLGGVHNAEAHSTLVKHSFISQR